MNATYTIAQNDVAQFNKLLANAQKKADKLGVPAITAAFSAPFVTEARDRNNILRFVTMVTVTLTGTTPKYAGWKLVGIVSPLKADDGSVLPIITTVPGETVKGNGQARDPLACDHCKLRRDRLESFIVTHDDGTEKQVGRSCLADFLGDVRMSPGGLASLMNTLASISNSVAEWHRGERKFDSESLNLVMAASLSCIRSYGWVSSKEAHTSNGNKTATKVRVQDAVNAFLSRPEDETTGDYKAWLANIRCPLKDLPTAADFDTAADYREKLGVILDTKESTEGLNDYLSAIRILNYAGAVNHKAMGIAVSIVPLIERETNVKTDPVKDLLVGALKTSQHIGEPKKRQTFSGVTFIENFATGAGYSIATFVTPEGNILKTFTHQTLLRGQKVNLKATTVRHSEYKGAKETIVNRPVVVA